MRPSALKKIERLKKVNQLLKEVTEIIRENLGMSEMGEEPTPFQPENYEKYSRQQESGNYKVTSKNKLFEKYVYFINMIE